jgi:hypothetical protein
VDWPAEFDAQFEKNVKDGEDAEFEVPPTPPLAETHKDPSIPTATLCTLRLTHV